MHPPLFPWFTRRRTATAIAVAAAIVGGLLVASPAQAAGPAGGAPAGGLVGVGSTSIDERTGHLRTSVDVGGLPGAGAGQVSLSLTYHQSGALLTGDLGSGWSWNLARVDGGTRVRLADGRSFDLDTRTPSGLSSYPSQDVAFTTHDDPLAAGSTECPATRICRYTLTHLDGVREHFDTKGLLSAISDRHGNVSRYTWDAAGQLTQIQGGFKEAPVTATIQGDGTTTTVTFPTRSDGLTPTASLVFKDMRLAKVTDTAGSVTEITHVKHDSGWYPNAFTTSAGVKTAVTYSRHEPGVWAVAEVRTQAAADSAELAPTLVFSLNPIGNGLRNYTGYPSWHSQKAPAGAGTTDALLASDDAAYRYSTTVSDGQQKTTRVFNNRHQKLSESTSVTFEGADRVVSEMLFTHPGAEVPWSQVPATYNIAEKVTQRTIDPTASSRSRETTVTTQLDPAGRPTCQTVSGVQTCVVYDTGQTEKVSVGQTRGYGLPIEVTKTVVDGPDAGSVQRERSTLSEDRKDAVATVAEATDPATGNLVIVRENSVDYNDAGEIVQSSSTSHGDDGSVQTTTESIGYTVDADAGVRVVTTTDAASGATTQKLDLTSGLLVEHIDAAGGVSTTQYDAGGAPIVQVGPDGEKLTTRYERAGLLGEKTNTVTQTRASDGYAAREVRDSLDRVVRIEDNQVRGGVSAGSWRTRAETGYDKRGNVAWRSDGKGQRTSFEHDAGDRVVAAIGPDRSRVETSYDEVGGTTIEKVYAPDAPLPHLTRRTTQDDQGRTTSAGTEHGDGSAGGILTYAYDGFGQVTSSTDSRTGFTLQHSYTASGALASTTMSDASSDTPLVQAVHSADAAGNQTGKTLAIAGQGEAAAHALGYDETGAPVTQTRPDGSTITSSRDTAGRISRVSYPDGRTLHIEHEPRSARVSKTWWTVAGDETRHEEKLFTWNLDVGKIASIAFASDVAGSRISYDYRPDGLLVRVGYPGGKSIAYDYADEDELTSITDAAGVTTHYSYNAIGVLVRAAQATVAVEYEWDARGNLAKLTRLDPAEGDRIVSATVLSHDDAGNVLTQTTTDASGVVVQSETHTWDRNGRLERTVTERTIDADSPSATDATLEPAPEAETAPETAAAASDPLEVLLTLARYTTTFHYDPQSRLSASVVTTDDATEVLRTDYTVNAASDVTGVSITTPEGAATTRYVVDENGRRTQVTVEDELRTQEWDATGALRSDARGFTYTYTVSGMLASWTNAAGETTRLTWWADGTRRTKTTADGLEVTSYTLSGDTAQVISETIASSAGTVTHSSLLGMAREATTRSTGEVTWLLADRRGDIVATLERTGSIITGRSVYSDYGRKATTADGSAHQPYGYTGAYTDCERTGTGMLWLAARHYQPETASFSTEDTANVLNRYAYAAADPIRFFDPTGHSPDWVNWTSIGFAALGLLAAPFTGGASTALIVAALAVAVADVTLALDEAGLIGKLFGMEGNLFGDKAQNIIGWVLLGISVADGVGTVAKAAHRIAKKFRPSQLVDAEEGAESIIEAINANAIQRGQNCIVATQSVRATLLTGNLKLSPEYGGKYNSRGTWHQINPTGAPMLGPFQDWADVDRAIAKMPEFSVIDVFQDVPLRAAWEVLGTRGVIGKLTGSVSHTYTAVRARGTVLTLDAYSGAGKIYAGAWKLGSRESLPIGGDVYLMHAGTIPEAARGSF